MHTCSMLCSYMHTCIYAYMCRTAYFAYWCCLPRREPWCKMLIYISFLLGIPRGRIVNPLTRYDHTIVMTPTSSHSIVLWSTTSMFSEAQFVLHLSRSACSEAPASHTSMHAQQWHHRATRVPSLLFRLRRLSAWSSTGTRQWTVSGSLRAAHCRLGLW